MKKVVSLLTIATFLIPLEASAEEIMATSFCQKSFGPNTANGGTSATYIGNSAEKVLAKTSMVAASLQAATLLGQTAKNLTANGERVASLGNGDLSAGSAGGILRGMIIKINSKEEQQKIAYDFKFKSIIHNPVSAANTSNDVVAIYKLTDGSPISSTTAKDMLLNLEGKSEESTKSVLADLRKGVDPKSPLYENLEIMVNTSQGLLSTSLPRAEQLFLAVKSYNDVINSANLLYLTQPPEAFLAYQFIYTIFTTGDDSSAEAVAEAAPASETDAAAPATTEPEAQIQVAQ